MTAPFLDVREKRKTYWECMIVGHSPAPDTRSWWAFVHGVGTILTGVCICGLPIICCNRTMNWVPRFDIAEVPF